MKATDGMAMLCIRIVQRAALDVRHGRRESKEDIEHYDSAVLFFQSELYRMMMDYISLCVPDFNYSGESFPDGVAEHILV